MGTCLVLVPGPEGRRAPDPAPSKGGGQRPHFWWGPPPKKGGGVRLERLRARTGPGPGKASEEVRKATGDAQDTAKGGAGW